MPAKRNITDGKTAEGMVAYNLEPRPLLQTTQIYLFNNDCSNEANFRITQKVASVSFWRNTNKSYRSKIDKTHLFQQKKYYRIVIIYFKCGLFVKVVER